MMAVVNENNAVFIEKTKFLPPHQNVLISMQFKNELLAEYSLHFN